MASQEPEWLELAKARRRAQFMQQFPGAKIVTLRAILDTYSRISFSEYEVKFLTEFFHISKGKGRDISIGFAGVPYQSGDLKTMMEDGCLPLHSPSQLDMGFLFLKCDAGRSVFGRQKAVYPSFVGGEDEWIVGPAFKRYELAITSVGNAYRG